MRAIVTGASGLLGSELVAALLAAGHHVVAISRRKVTDLPDYRQSKLAGAEYISLDLSDTEKLFYELNDHFLDNDELVVFHLAWWGDQTLSDLNVTSQYQNVVVTTKFYQMCAKLNATKFIFAGTMEEAFALEYTRMNYRKDNKYNRHVVYALAKHTARNALKNAYFVGCPNLVFASNSHIMGPCDDKDSFLQVALQKIIDGEKLFMSSGEQIFDVIDVTDCASAYLALAESGQNGVSYWIGSGEPRPLKQYVKTVNKLYGPSDIYFGKQPFEDVILTKETFCVENLTKDTSFRTSMTFEDSCRKLADWLQFQKT